MQDRATARDMTPPPYPQLCRSDRPNTLTPTMPSLHVADASQWLVRAQPGQKRRPMESAGRAAHCPATYQQVVALITAQIPIPVWPHSENEAKLKDF